MCKKVITPIPEVADKYTIALLKIERLDSSEMDVDDMRRQIEYYKAGLDLKNKELAALVDQLYEINSKMWDNEHAIRKGQDENLGLEEIAKRAIYNRNLNRDRIKLKNKIIELTGDGFKDIKMNYAK